MSEITQALDFHRAQGTYRTLRVTGALEDFSSNDYLGLSKCPKIKAQLIRALETGCPLGATGSRLLSGHTEYHERVEHFLIRAFNASAALLFSSGYMANLAVLSVLGSLESEFFSDQLNHASLIDGIRQNSAAKRIFRHNDLNHLENLLGQSRARNKVIVTESVFSMDGDLAPIAELVELSRRFNAWLVVDEAHATGVFGPKGLGCLEGIQDEQLISIHTGGKALGGQGAFVLSSHKFRELLINRARNFIFNTALSPLSALQIEYALQDILTQPLRGARLLTRAENFKNRLPAELSTRHTQSQVIPIMMGSNDQALRVAGVLQNRGFDVRAIRSPTVRVGSERLRVTIKSAHSENVLNDFIAILTEVMK